MDFLDKACKNRFKTEKNHHRILHIRNSLGTKFQLKLTILIFFDQIYPRREFPLENGKIALKSASTVVIYYIKLFRTGANRHNGILMFLWSHICQFVEFVFNVRNNVIFRLCEMLLTELHVDIACIAGSKQHIG